MPAALVDQVGEQLRREQHMTVVDKQGVHRPGRDQVATPGRCVQLVIGWVGVGAHAGESAFRHESSGYQRLTATLPL
jgi:hypothetical protein